MSADARHDSPQPPRREGAAAGMGENAGATTPSAVAGTTSQPARGPGQDSTQRSRWKRPLLIVAVLGPLFTACLWISVHRIPWMGPLVANSLRAVVGRDNVARLEDFVYAIEDRVNLTLKANKKPRAYWKVNTAAPGAPIAARPPSDAGAPPGSAEPDERPSLAPFAPQAVGPAQETFAAEGDGQWVPMGDPRRPEEAPRLFKTLLHPDKTRSWAEVFVVAVDLRTVSLRPVMGYQEPRSDKKEAEGYVRPAKIPEDHWSALLGAFNGGFMAEHGHYGVFFDGITFLDPKDDACTLAQFADGHLEVQSWPRMSERQAEMIWYRQAPNCMYESGKMHPFLEVYRARKWGATLDGETVIRRSAVGISADQQILFVGISNHTNAKVMALGMRHAGAVHVAQMDVNWSYPKFVTYEPDEAGKLLPVALAEGFEFSSDLYLRERSMRDFFYLVRKEEVPPLALPLTPKAGSQRADAQGSQADPAPAPEPAPAPAAVEPSPPAPPAAP